MKPASKSIRDHSSINYHCSSEYEKCYQKNPEKHYRKTRSDPVLGLKTRSSKRTHPYPRSDGKSLNSNPLSTTDSCKSTSKKTYSSGSTKITFKNDKSYEVNETPVKSWLEDVEREDKCTPGRFNMSLSSTYSKDADNQSETNTKDSYHYSGRYELETDPIVLKRREKQLNMGKNSNHYSLYCKEVPRKQRSSQHPQTPDKSKRMSRREWDTRVKKWKRAIHAYFADTSQAEKAVERTEEKKEVALEEKETEPPIFSEETTSLVKETDNDNCSESESDSLEFNDDYDKFEFV